MLTFYFAPGRARPAVKRTIEIETAIGYELPDWFPAAGKPAA